MTDYYFAGSPRKKYTERFRYTRILPFYCQYWGVSASTYLRIVGESLTGYSRYVEIGGTVKCVPREILTHP